MCNKDNKGLEIVCVGVYFLAFNVLLQTKSDQKVIVILFCTPIIFKNPLKPVFDKKYTFITCVGL